MSDVKRVVNTKFWDDEKVINEFSPEDKYFMLYILTNKHTTQLGIYHLVPKQAAFELGYSTEAVIVLLDRFEKKYDIIRYSKETNEIAIRNYLFHSVIKGGKPVMDCLLKEEAGVIDKALLMYVMDGLERKYEQTPGRMNQTVLEYLMHLRESNITYSSNNNLYIDPLYINKKNKDNDNDNERFVDDSWTIRTYDQKSADLREKSKKFIPPNAEEVRAYCDEKGYKNVNPESFVAFYGSKNWMVGKNKMTSWRSAVAGWNARNKERSAGKSTYVVDTSGIENWCNT